MPGAPLRSSSTRQRALGGILGEEDVNLNAYSFSLPFFQEEYASGFSVFWDAFQFFPFQLKKIFWLRCAVA